MPLKIGSQPSPRTHFVTQALNMRNRHSPLLIRTMVTLLQRPPLAMFDPSSIHRNDEIFNPEPNWLGIFLSAAA